MTGWMRRGVNGGTRMSSSDPLVRDGEQVGMCGLRRLYVTRRSGGLCRLPRGLS